MEAIILSAGIPSAITGLLVMPIPNYHNTLVAIQSVLKYYNGRKIYNIYVFLVWYKVYFENYKGEEINSLSQFKGIKE